MKRTPVISTTPEEIEANTGMATGMEAATIQVIHADGKITRFFVALRINKRDQAICEIATNKGDDTTISKRITGIKWDN
jgi:hypothetical protein